MGMVVGSVWGLHRGGGLGILLHTYCGMLPPQEYCRELVAEDLEGLVPKYINPLDDPSFVVPPLGRQYEPDDGALQSQLTTMQFGQDAV